MMELETSSDSDCEIQEPEINTITIPDSPDATRDFSTDDYDPAEYPQQNETEEKDDCAETSETPPILEIKFQNSETFQQLQQNLCRALHRVFRETWRTEKYRLFIDKKDEDNIFVRAFEKRSKAQRSTSAALSEGTPPDDVVESSPFTVFSQGQSDTAASSPFQVFAHKNSKSSNDWASSHDGHVLAASTVANSPQPESSTTNSPSPRKRFAPVTRVSWLHGPKNKLPCHPVDHSREKRIPEVVEESTTPANPFQVFPDDVPPPQLPKEAPKVTTAPSTTKRVGGPSWLKGSANRNTNKSVESPRGPNIATPKDSLKEQNPFQVFSDIEEEEEEIPSACHVLAATTKAQSSAQKENSLEPLPTPAEESTQQTSSTEQRGSFWIQGENSQKISFGSKQLSRDPRLARLHQRSKSPVQEPTEDSLGSAATEGPFQVFPAAKTSEVPTQSAVASKDNSTSLTPLREQDKPSLATNKTSSLVAEPFQVFDKDPADNDTTEGPFVVFGESNTATPVAAAPAKSYREIINRNRGRHTWLHGSTNRENCKHLEKHHEPRPLDAVQDLSVDPNPFQVFPATPESNSDAAPGPFAVFADDQTKSKPPPKATPPKITKIFTNRKKTNWTTNKTSPAEPKGDPNRFGTYPDSVPSTDGTSPSPFVVFDTPPQQTPPPNTNVAQQIRRVVGGKSPGFQTLSKPPPSGLSNKSPFPVFPDSTEETIPDSPFQVFPDKRTATTIVRNPYSVLPKKKRN